jgi:hypothetical protein
MKCDVSAQAVGSNAVANQSRQRGAVSIARFHVSVLFGRDPLAAGPDNGMADVVVMGALMLRECEDIPQSQSLRPLVSCPSDRVSYNSALRI